MCALQQLQRCAVQSLSVISRGTEGGAPGDSVEIRELDLELHNAASHARFAQAPTHAQCLGMYMRSQALQAGQILLEGILGAYALGGSIGDDLARIVAAGQVPEVASVRAEAFLEPRRILRRDVADRAQTTARKLLLSLATHAPQAR